MVASKAIAIAKEIDTARCKGNWQAIPELARRYRKHNPNGLALEQSILAEANLHNLVQANRSDSKRAFAKDSPDNISLSTRVDPDIVKPVQQQLSTALGDKDSSAETQQVKQMSRVVLAQSWFESGQYQKSLDAIQEAGYRGAEPSSGYYYVAYVQALSIRAMSLDLLGTDYVDAYTQLAHQVYGGPNIIERTMVDWVEEALYRGSLLALKKSADETMPLVRAYQKACGSQLSSWRVYKRLAVTRYALEYLSKSYLAGRYQPPVDFAETEDGKQCSEDLYAESKRAYDHQLFSIEVMQLHAVYEKLVYSIAHFPRSGQNNSIVLDFVDRLAADFDIVGGTESEKRAFVEVLNRASLKTFNSPCVTRHLFHALVNLGDYEEAEHALHTYLYLVGLESKALIDARSQTPALASDSFGNNIPVPSADDKEEKNAADSAKNSDGPQRSEEEESTKNKLKLLVTAVKMYCRELGKGADAVNTAEIAEHLYASEAAHDESLVRLGAQVYRSLGVAFGFLASQTFDQDRRPKYYEKALSALKKSLSLDNGHWKTYYQLALQLAEMRDIVQAIGVITQALQLKSDYLPSWHLLCLLCTCPVRDSHPQALKTCNIALEGDAKNMAHDSWIDYSDEILQHVLLEMTQVLLVDRVHGTEAALASQKALFHTFGKIVVPELIPDSSSSNRLYEAVSGGIPLKHNLVLSGSLGNMSVDGTNGALDTTTATGGTRSRSASNPSLMQKGRARSVSSFTGRKFHISEMFGASHLDKADASSVRSVPPMQTLHKHGSKLSLLDPKSLIRKQKKEVNISGGNGSGNGSTRGIGALEGGSMSSFHSTTPSLISSSTILQPTTPPTSPTTHAKLQQQRSCKMYCDLWLLSAEIYLRSGRLEEARKAVSEAEKIDWTTHAGVWCFLGRIRLAQNQPEKAIVAFQKGLVTQPNDVNCRVWLARTYFEQGHLEVAEGLLQAVTQENGWDNAAAWFYLSEIYKQTDRLSKTKDCLFYALELESTTPIQPFTILPRFA